MSNFQVYYNLTDDVGSQNCNKQYYSVLEYTLTFTWIVDAKGDTLVKIQD